MLIPVNLFEEWLSNKGLKERSIKNYLYYFHKLKYPKFTQESISRFLSEKSNRNTIARAFLVNLKECMLVNSNELKIDPYYYKEINDVMLPKITGRSSKKLINTLSFEEINLLEKTLSTEELKIMLLLSYYAGLRLGELLKIRVNSFNWEIWKVNTEKMGEVRVFGKGDKEGIAIIPHFIMARITKYIRSNSDKYKSLDSRLFMMGQRSFQKYLQQAGIDSGITKTNEHKEVIPETSVHPHKLRHSYAHNLLIKGVDIRYIKEALRHSSIQSTQIYTQLDKEELKDKLGSVKI